MATKTKAPVRTGGGKGSRRPPVRVKKGNDIPLLPIAVIAILLVFSIGLIIYYLANNKSTAPALAAGIPCDQLEHTQIHYHAAVQIVYQGNILPIPANIGIVTRSGFRQHDLLLLAARPSRQHRRDPYRVARDRHLHARPVFLGLEHVEQGPRTTQRTAGRDPRVHPSRPSPPTRSSWSTSTSRTGKALSPTRVTRTRSSSSRTR